ncbi:glycosidase [Mycoplasmopsis mustelae]|uniref:Alpha-amylase n=2 Tax=Mycoplasmopsis mustelae TaxID=171289 RepID=A0A4R7UE55_9BACT|nr:alpha-amylase family glycosyl hydrolase [Mycoplasmopsis mustelae]TDV24211.1 glycosidase [Mycoplasmopsis mustelae]
MVKLQDKIIYQIFPRSFYDANNDGDGDLQGIIAKLPYLKQLGINAIWLCPTYDTNFVDAGYDVLNYKSVWKQFGTLEDFKEMSSKATELGIDIIMDIVLNHVSNQHQWFLKACESENNIEHSYFIWRKQLNEQELKAQSIFGGSAWEYVPSVKKYYFHLFSKEQVDLNWSHPNTIKAMAEVIDFWYDLGVRGFRLDAIKHVSKTFDNVEANPYFAWCKGSVEFLKEFNKQAFANKPDAYTLGEASGITADELLYYGKGERQVSQNYFNFSWWWIGWSGQTGRNGYDANWDYKQFVYQQQPFQHNNLITTEMFTNFLSNHDTSRSISRWGDEGIFHNEAAKTHALMLMTLKGIPCIYYGEEIGLLNTHFKHRSEFRDCDIQNGFIDLVDKQKIYSESEFLKYLNINSRDSGRCLMQWDNSTNSGFNAGYKPWINLGRNPEINVTAALKDSNSIFYFYQKLIQMRKENYRNLLVLGTSEITLTKNGLIKITRQYQNSKLIAYLNITKHQIVEKIELGDQILSTYQDQKIVKNFFRPYESILLFQNLESQKGK